MKAKVKASKKFDAVDFMRLRREQISKETEGMTPDEEIRYIQEMSKQFRTKAK